jgi:hypothetical protein
MVFVRAILPYFIREFLNGREHGLLRRHRTHSDFLFLVFVAASGQR